jgi:hypothetical protein
MVRGVERVRVQQRVLVPVAERPAAEGVRHRDQPGRQVGGVDGVARGLDLADQLVVQGAADQVQQVAVAVDVAVQRRGGHPDRPGHRTQADLLAAGHQGPARGQDLVPGLRPEPVTPGRRRRRGNGVDFGHAPQHSEHRSL